MIDNWTELDRDKNLHDLMMRIIDHGYRIDDITFRQHLKLVNREKNECEIFYGGDVWICVGEETKKYTVFDIMKDLENDPKVGKLIEDNIRENRRLFEKDSKRGIGEG